ncbi:MAG: hypothetical protein IJ545_06795 [Alphaproteobacteria bacterium]|nr:hypothetical protein [Alphaproteobacteria bacterium]
MIIYTDSSYNERFGVAGIGCLIIDGEKRRIFSNWIELPNNNVGELYAIYYALTIASRATGPHTVYTDSQTAIAFIQGTIKDKPLTPQQQRNRLECQKWAYRINRIMPEGLTIEKIKAHTGHYQTGAINNAIADLLAKEGIVKYMNAHNLPERKRRGREY